MGGTGFQGLWVILMFVVVVGLPCFFVAWLGSGMINELGNHPSQSAKIQAATGWKILLVEIISFVLLVGIFAFLYNIQHS